RITRIGLNAITSTLRHQPRSDNLTIDPSLGEVAVQPETGRASFVAAANRRPPAQQLLDRLLVVGQRALLQQLVGAHRREPDRTCVHVQPDSYRRRLDHGRRPPYVALPGQTPATHDKCVGADHSLPATGHRRTKATAPSCLRLTGRCGSTTPTRAR